MTTSYRIPLALDRSRRDLLHRRRAPACNQVDGRAAYVPPFSAKIWRTTLPSSASRQPGLPVQPSNKLGLICGNSISLFRKSHFRNPLAQLILADLAGGIEWQLIDELHVTRHLEARHAFAGPG